MSRRPRAVVAFLLIDGERVDVVLDPGTVTAILRAQRLASRKRQRDLDRIVQAQLERDPEATLDELCAVARRNRKDVSDARVRVRALGIVPDGSSRGRAVPGPENGMPADAGALESADSSGHANAGSRRGP